MEPQEEIDGTCKDVIEKRVMRGLFAGLKKN